MNQPEFEYLGPYKIERILGRGGMGTVYKGFHAKSGEPVAIKVIATGIANHMRFRRRFASEVETLKLLKHPNIVQLIGHGEEQGLLFYSMEFVEGHSLHEHLRQHGKLPWPDVIQIGIEMTAALKHAHDMGIIHRDLKPANLMLNADGHVKLTDFGIAKLFGSSDMTIAGSVIGTADYMPPEQAEGKSVTVRSDLYSLGGVMYALLAGKAPYGGKSVPEVLYAVRYNPVPNLLDRAPDVPVELAELIHHLLEKDIHKRPPTALVVGNRLKALQRGLQHRAAQFDPHDTQAALMPPSAVGPQLTSLDLSDVDDDELQLTGEEVSQEGASEAELRDETSRGFPQVGTHEQQTVLAPDGMLHPSSAASQASPPKLEQSDSSEQVEVSAEFHSLASEVEPLSSGGPSHFTPVSGAEKNSLRPGYESTGKQHGIDWLHYGSLAGIVVLLLASFGLGWWMLKPQSADRIYSEISAAAESGDESDLLQVGARIDEFLTRFPDDERSAELKSLANEIELTRWTRILQRRASRAGGMQQLSAIEQGFLDCMRLLPRDAEQAQVKLAAFVTIFGSIEDLPRDEARLVALAKYALRSGARATSDPLPVAASQLQKLIQSAEASLTGQRLNDFYTNLLLLYGDKAWAAEQMNRVRQKLRSEP